MTQHTARHYGKVLVLGNDTRVTLAVIRSLGRRNLEVHVGWHGEHSPAIASRYVREVHCIPPYDQNDDAWKKVLQDLLREYNFELVIPCNDPTLIPLQLHRDEFEDLAPIYLLDDDVFRIVFDKIHTTALAELLGVSVPRTVFGTSRDETLAACNDLKFPLYVKPRSSVTTKDLVNKQVVQRVDNAGELARQLDAASSTNEVLIQETFSGIGVGVEVLASEGQVLAELQHRRLHESIAGGSSYRETIPQDARLTRATGTLIESLNFSGVAMFEYRLNPESGEWVLLEINARFWGSLPLAIAAGMDFPYYLYELLVKQKKDLHTEYRCGQRARNLIEDLRWMKGQLSNDFGRASEVIGELLRIATGRDYLDQWAWDDWRPQIKEIAQLVQSTFENLSARLFAKPATAENLSVETSLLRASPPAGLDADSSVVANKCDRSSASIAEDATSYPSSSKTAFISSGQTTVASA